MDPALYLAHIGAAPGASLAELHERHLLRVPFENLDIHRGVPIALDEEAFLEKIVGCGRGGFCYELNGAFAWLLRRLGHRVTLLSAEVKREGGWGMPFGHLALRVDLDRAWLADVGFGDAFLLPLPLDGEAVLQGGRRFEVAERDGYRVVLRDGAPLYRFTLEPHALAEFEEGCRFHQTSPLSPFTKGRLWSLMRPDGRITLTEDRLIETRGAARTETPISDFEVAFAALRGCEGIPGVGPRPSEAASGEEGRRGVSAERHVEEA